MARDIAMRSSRRRLLQGASALIAITCLPARAAEGSLPAIPELTTFLAGRTPRRERVRMELPRIADNGLSVPMRLAVSGPFAPGSFVRKLALFAEINPVPDMAVFEFPQPLERIDIDTRVRLAGTQQIVAVAEMTDGTLFATSMEVIVTLGGCMDGT